VCFDHVRFPDGGHGRYTRIRHPQGISGVVVLAVKVSASQVLVGLIEGFRYPVGRVCLEVVRGFGESGDAADARRELAEELGVDGHLIDLGPADPDTGTVETTVHLYGCLVTSKWHADADPTELNVARWLPVQDVWDAVAAGQITCAMSLAVLLRAQLVGLLPGPGAAPDGQGGEVLRAIAAAAHGLDRDKVALLTEHPSRAVRAAAAGNHHTH
jgi:8-oxo-dGTP pyrophosphatase MutT (NUDIX family)